MVIKYIIIIVIFSTVFFLLENGGKVIHIEKLCLNEKKVLSKIDVLKTVGRLLKQSNNIFLINIMNLKRKE